MLKCTRLISRVGFVCLAFKKILQNQFKCKKQLTYKIKINLKLQIAINSLECAEKPSYNIKTSQ